MKARVPASYENLPKNERQKISDYAREIGREMANEQFRTFFKIIILALNATDKFGKKRTNRLLNKLVEFMVQYRAWERDEVQTELLDNRFNKIIGEVDLNRLEEQKSEKKEVV